MSAILDDDTQLVALSPFQAAEYETLKQFYTLWESLHALPKDKAHHFKATNIAKEMVETAHVLRRMNRPSRMKFDA